MKKPDAILCSDFHLREDQPICRTDNFWEAQWRKVDFIAKLQRDYGCPVLHAGDLFHHWKPSPYLLSMAMEHLPENFHTVYGQHDLPNHNLELKHKSGIYALETADVLEVYEGGSWGNSNLTQMTVKGKTITLWHNFTYIGKDPWPGITAPKAYTLLEQYKQFDLIVTGDNHQSFSIRGVSGNLLVNPGCLTRQEADQIDFQPRVYLWYAETNEVIMRGVPIEENVITREHIEVKEEKYNRITAFIEKLSTGYELSTNFEENIYRFFETNRVRNDVRSIITKAMEDEK